MMNIARILVGVMVVWGNMSGALSAQDRYANLAKQLADAFPTQRIENYSQQDFVFDPSIRRSVGAEAVATSDQSFAVNGMPVQKDIILLQFKHSASPAAIKRLLDQYHLDVRDSVPDIGLIVAKMTRQTPAVTEAATDESASDAIAALKKTIQSLRNEDIVRTAAVNTLLSTTRLPTPTNAKGRSHTMAEYFWDFRKGQGTPEANRRDGNWGQKFVNFPSAWNFNDVIAARGNPTVHVGVLDVGFGEHEDLLFVASSSTPMKTHDHGTHVTGIIAGRSDNSVGVCGCTPFASVTACSALSITEATTIPQMQPVLSDVIATLIKFIRKTPNLRVVNISLAYNWVPIYSRNPNTDAEIQDHVKSHGVIVRQIAEEAAEKGVILVCAAGNDSRAVGFPDVKAEFASPFNWAAVNNAGEPTPATNIIVVEAINRDGQRSSFSNIRGSVSAPGEEILSTVAFGDLGLANNAYAAHQGTSMAAPHVTALIAHMYAYQPNLTMQQVLDILDVRTNNRPATTNPAPIINAFDAMVKCNPKQAFRDLADLDQDGTVNMQDFNLFRAALRQVEGAAGVVAKDLNGDNVIAPDPANPTAPDENVFPRADLNGSGKLARNGDARLVNGEMLSDLEVMQKAWQDATVRPQDLANLLDIP